MAGDSGTYEVVTSRYLKDRDEPCFPGSERGSGGGGGELGKGDEDEEEEEEEEKEEKEHSGRKVAGASSSSSGDPTWAASGYELIDGTLYRKRLERGATSYTEVLVAPAEEQRRAVIAAFHQQPAPGHRHCTMEETYKNVSENYWWEEGSTYLSDSCTLCSPGLMFLSCDSFARLISFAEIRLVFEIFLGVVATPRFTFHSRRIFFQPGKRFKIPSLDVARVIQHGNRPFGPTDVELGIRYDKAACLAITLPTILNMCFMSHWCTGTICRGCFQTSETMSRDAINVKMEKIIF
eukprot:g45367.t1